MIRLRLLLTLSLLAFCSSVLSAQDDELKVGLRAGHNAAFDSFAALSLETVQTIGQNISISGGLQYNTIGKTALEVRPAYNMNFNWGKVSAEVLAAYTNLTSINSFATGAGAASRISLGSAVVFGMLLSTILGTLFIPNFYHLMQSLYEKRKRIRN